MKSNNPIPRSYLWRGILSIILGIILIAWPKFAASYLVVIIGAMILTVGVIVTATYYRRARNRDQIGLGLPGVGIVCIIAGIVLLAMPATFAAIMITVMGLLLVFGAIEQMYMLIQAARRGFKVSPMRYLGPVLILIAGIVVAVSPVESMKFVIMVFGIAIILYGVIDLLDQYMIRSSK